MSDLYLIDRESRVRDALRQLEHAESGTLIVVADDRTLLGTLTDGDVRRWILGGGDLDGIVDQVCHRRPFAVGQDHDLVQLKREMVERGITCIPVVDPQDRVTDVLLWRRLFGDAVLARQREPLDLPVVIMAGGAGTRLAPFTSVLPKPLIPVGGKTVIELIVDTFTAHGVSEFYLSVHYKSRIIKSYFDELDPPYTVRYLYEDEPLGTAGSLHGLAGKVDRDLLVTNCDVIVRIDLNDFVSHHRDRDNDITLVVALKHYRLPYGVCDIEAGGQLRELREKPEFSHLVNAGLYVLKPGVLDLIPAGRHTHFTDLIAATQAHGGRVGVFPIGEEALVDLGEWTAYRSAVASLTLEQHVAGD